jgi:diacylglycerol O-acyltransferase / wax synthase
VPGGDTELLEWLADFYSHRLDRTRPLWEMTLLDGLAGGRWALATKVHHCLIDGVSGSVLTALLLDSSPAGTPALEGAAGAASGAGAGPPGLRGVLAAGARAGVGAMLHPRRLLEMLERSRALAELLRDEIVPAARTSLNVPIGATRRLDVVDTSLDELKAIKRALGGTVNDVVLAVSAGGIRRLLMSRGDMVPDGELRAMVPVSVRVAGDQLALGNRVSSLFVALPVAEPDPMRRYKLTAAAAEALKSGRQAAGSEAAVELAGLAPPAVHALVARMSFTPRLFNVTITNVPGSPVTLYALGAPMRRIVPLVPIFAYHAVGIAVVSYDGRVSFGLNGDRASMPDLHVLAEGIEQSLAELRSLAGLERAAVGATA